MTAAKKRMKAYSAYQVVDEDGSTLGQVERSRADADQELRAWKMAGQDNARRARVRVTELLPRRKGRK